MASDLGSRLIKVQEADEHLTGCYIATREMRGDGTTCCTVCFGLMKKRYLAEGQLTYCFDSGPRFRDGQLFLFLARGGLCYPCTSQFRQQCNE